MEKKVAQEAYVTENSAALIGSIERNRLMVAVRTTTPDEAYRAAVACIEGGIKFIEITFSVPEADSVIRKLSGDGRVTMGAGTILTLEDARRAVAAGAKYLVSPNLDEEIIKFTKDAGLVSIPGACTPTEIYRAFRAGGDIIKIFPFLQAGGLGFLKEIRGPLPFLKYMAAGGVNLGNILDYLDAGASCILVGSSIIKRDLVKAGQWRAITELAMRFVGRLTET
jgi:2-dehydro-3-deoxyphosphogluconate aldolase / (4S)-4-hydroxy-2-oxoglutarate aldolase